jgi:hypothetical protein
MPDIAHRDSVYGHGPNIVPAHAAFGDSVTKTMRPNAPGSENPNIQPAGLFSTAPYKGDTLGPTRRDGKLCNWEEKPCRAYATRTGYCAGHNKSLGLS